MRRRRAARTSHSADPLPPAEYGRAQGRERLPRAYGEPCEAKQGSGRDIPLFTSPAACNLSNLVKSCNSGQCAVYIYRKSIPHHAPTPFPRTSPLPSHKPAINQKHGWTWTAGRSLFARFGTLEELRRAQNPGRPGSPGMSHVLPSLCVVLCVCLCVFVCVCVCSVLSSRCLVCRPSHLCV